MFRLVLCCSRFQLSGGHSVTIRNDNGTITRTTPAEILLPRYQVPESYWGTYVLETWRSPESLACSNHNSRELDMTDPANPIRCLEPIWPEGAYEAVMRGPENPFIFPRNAPTEMIEWGIFVTKLRWSVAVDEIMRIRREEAIKEKEKERTATIEELRGKRRAFIGEPMVTVPA